jgi:hypothetical protein
MNVRDFLANLFPSWVCWLGQQIIAGIDPNDAMLVKPFVPDLSEVLPPHLIEPVLVPVVYNLIGFMEELNLEVLPSSLGLLHIIWMDQDIWIFISNRGNEARFQKMISMRRSRTKSSKLRRSANHMKPDRMKIARPYSKPFYD